MRIESIINIAQIPHNHDFGSSICFTNLHRTIGLRNFRLFRLLFEAGGKRFYNNTQEWINYIIAEGNLEMFKYLISENLIDPKDPIWLDMIIKQDLSFSLPKIKHLISIGVSIEDKKDTLLIAAIKNLEVLKYLISLGANIHQNDDGVFKLVVSNNLLSATEFLIFKVFIPEWKREGKNMNDIVILLKNILPKEYNKAATFVEGIISTLEYLIENK